MPAGKTSASLAVLPTPQREPETPAPEAEDLVGAVRRYVDNVVLPLRERLVAQAAEIEVLKAQVPDRGYIDRAISDQVHVRLCAVPPPEPGLSVEDLEAAIAPIREQIAELRARPEPAPGRDGLPGLPGRDGAPGKDGADGLGFDDLAVLYDGERGLTFRFSRGEKVKNFQLIMPVLLDRGFYQEGPIYAKGDCISFGGSMWIAQQETSEKPSTRCPDHWRLAVKHGRDGKDGEKGSKGDKGDPGRPGRDFTLLGAG
jgi:hypothetical protein